MLDTDSDCKLNKKDLVGKYGLNETKGAGLIGRAVAELKCVGFYILFIQIDQNEK